MDGESGNDGAPRNLFFMLADQVSESDEGDDEMKKLCVLLLGPRR